MSVSNPTTRGTKRSTEHPRPQERPQSRPWLRHQPCFAATYLFSIIPLPKRLILNTCLHIVSMTVYVPWRMEIADRGHFLTHRPHPTHAVADQITGTSFGSSCSRRWWGHASTAEQVTHCSGLQRLVSITACLSMCGTLSPPRHDLRRTSL